MSAPKTYNRKKLIHVWEYKNKNSQVIGFVARYEDNDGKKEIIPFFKRNGTNWAAGIDLKPKPIYGIDKLAKHKKENIVIVVEGEKCAAALNSLGLCAVTSLGGSQSAKLADWTPLDGHKFVLLMPDNDAAGEKYIEDVFRGLMVLPEPPEIMILRLSELPDKGDVVDWLEKRVNGWNGYSAIQQSLHKAIKEDFRSEFKNRESVPDEWRGLRDSQTQTTQATDDDTKTLAFNFPTFDSKNYYGIAGEIAKLASENSEADIMAVYVSFLTAAAAMLGRHKYIWLGDSKHYARIFAALVGASSRSRKGTSFKSVRHIIRKTEEIYLKRSTTHVFDSLCIADGGLSSAEGLIFAVRDEAEQTSGKSNTPLWDAVIDKRLLVVEEELANVLKISQREGNTLSPLLRKAWDGGTLAPMTKNNRLKATDPHINVIGHITQYELKFLISDSDIHNGLSNRFLWVCVRRTQKMAFPRRMDDSKLLAMAIRLSDALMKSEIEEVVDLSQEAREYWTLQYPIVSADITGLMGSITSRSEAYVLRIGLLFCLLDGVNQIEQKHLKAAVDLVAFCNQSVEFIFSTPADSEAGTDADKLLKALAKKPMTQTEISRLFSNNKTRRQLMELLTELQALNKVKSSQQIGTKKIIWEIIK
jgi:Protein of unknown function (DUF3987)